MTLTASPPKGSDLPYEIATTAEPGTDEWRAVNRTSIGSSDAAAVLGLSPYESPYALYLTKIGELDPVEENEAMHFGKRLEGIVADELNERHDGELELSPSPGTLRSIAHPHMTATVDRIVRRVADGSLGVAEIKCTSAYLSGDWRDEAPDAARIQAQHQLAVLGPEYRFAYVCGLIGGNTYREFCYERDDELIAGIVAAEAEFWQRVVERRPPPLDGSDSTREALGDRYAASLAEAVELSEEALELRSQREIAKAAEGTAKDWRQRIEAELMAMLGENEIGLCDGRTVVTWKGVTTRRVDAKALREQMPEIAQQFTTESASRRLHFPAWKNEEAP